MFRSREIVRAILERRDPRLFVVVGPCSIHDVAAAREYAARLKALAEQVESTLLLIMRVYFEKPRTTVGWKGLINDPDLDDSFHIEKGIHMARELLLYVAELGLARGHRGARSHHAAVPVRAHHLDRDRRAHHRIADAPGDGERPVDAGRLQERHRRRARDLDQRACSRCGTRITSSASRSRGSRRCFARAAMRMRTSCCAAAAAAPTTMR